MSRERNNQRQKDIARMLREKNVVAKDKVRKDKRKNADTWNSNSFPWSILIDKNEPHEDAKLNIQRKDNGDRADSRKDAVAQIIKTSASSNQQLGRRKEDR